MTPLPPTAAPPYESPTPAPASTPTPAGSLGIKERKSWRTTQVILLCVLSMLIGMRIGYRGEKASATGGTVAPGQSGLPPAPTTVTTLAPGDPSQPTGRSGATDTSEPAGASGGTNAASSSRAPQVLTEVPPHTGALTTDAFTVAGGGWKLGWSFNCGGRAGGFNIAVRRPDGGEVSEDPPLQRNAVADKGIQELTSEGAHVLDVQTTCRWALKVTGVPG